MSRSITAIGAKRFCITVIGLWLFIVLIDRAAPLVLPSETWYFRPWEYTAGHHGLRRPNARLTVRNAYGDLGNFIGDPRLQKRRTITFTTDENGFRNTDVTPEADIWIVGQSFMAGAGNDDDDAPASQLSRALDRPVYAFAPANMSDALKSGAIDANQPSHVIWGIVERNLKETNDEMTELRNMTDCFDAYESSTIDRLKAYVKRVIFHPTDYVRHSIVKTYAIRSFKLLRYRLTGTHMTSVTVGKEGMLFLTETINMTRMNANERGFSAVVQAVENVHDCLAQKNVRLIFVPIPNKASIYSALLPDDDNLDIEPHPLQRLHESLKAKDVATVNAYRELRNASTAMRLYHPDDTHWNPQGIGVITQSMYDVMTSP